MSTLVFTPIIRGVQALTFLKFALENLRIDKLDFSGRLEAIVATNTDTCKRYSMCFRDIIGFFKCQPSSLQQITRYWYSTSRGWDEILRA